MYLVILIVLLNYHPSPTFIYVICLQWSDIVADSISLTTYKVVLLSIGNKLRNGYNTTLKPHPATPTSWPDHFESGGATPELTAPPTAGPEQVRYTGVPISCVSDLERVGNARLY